MIWKTTRSTSALDGIAFVIKFAAIPAATVLPWMDVGIKKEKTRQPFCCLVFCIYIKNAVAVKMELKV
ncbi:hypothetical protein [Bacillus smithii]|uniref:hypothetical protein n=1 Tax=Bacillus smithii TaxID=1479 RepID=UPI0030C8FCB6